MYYKGEPGVCIAVQYEQYEIVKYMVLSFDCTKLADKDKKRNALHYASLKGNTKIIELLLQNGFDVDSTDSDGNTPLFYSITYPFPDSVILLLEKGSNPNIQNKDGTTPLHFAIKKSNVLAMEYLMKAGADPNKPDIFTFIKVLYFYASKFHYLNGNLIILIYIPCILPPVIPRYYPFY